MIEVNPLAVIVNSAGREGRFDCSGREGIAG
jgi:hypothetical protein